MKKKSLINTVPILLIMILGIGLVWYSTQWGAGLISDTFQYVAGARSLVAGKGFSIPYGDGQLEPMTKYPPMFSVFLAGFEIFGVSALKGVRLLNTFLFGVNILLVFTCARRLIHSYYFAIFGSLLFALSFALIEVHSWALSKPLYICFGLCVLLALDKYFVGEKRNWLIVASLFASFAFLTRYVGLSLIVAVSVLLFIVGKGSYRKFSDTLLFGSVAILPMLAWTLRSYFFTGTLNDRSVEFHPLTIKNYVSAIDTILMWFLPPSIVEGNEKLILVILSILLVGGILYWARYFSRRFMENYVTNEKNIVLQILYVFAYGFMIIASKTWMDAGIGMSDRMLSPMLVSLIILFTVLLSFLWNTYGRVRGLVVIICLGLVTYYLSGTFVSVQRFHQGGIGIARRGWNRSDVVQSLRGFSSYSIYTNSNSSLYLWSDRAGYNIVDFELLKESGTRKKVLLVIFHNSPPEGKRLDNLIDGLKLKEEDQIVSVYELDPSP